MTDDARPPDLGRIVLRSVLALVFAECVVAGVIGLELVVRVDAWPAALPAWVLGAGLGGGIAWAVADALARGAGVVAGLLVGLALAPLAMLGGLFDLAFVQSWSVRRATAVALEQAGGLEAETWAAWLAAVAAIHAPLLVARWRGASDAAQALASLGGGLAVCGAFALLALDELRALPTCGYLALTCARGPLIVVGLRAGDALASALGRPGSRRRPARPRRRGRALAALGALTGALVHVAVASPREAPRGTLLRAGEALGDARAGLAIAEATIEPWTWVLRVGAPWPGPTRIASDDVPPPVAELELAAGASAWQARADSLEATLARLRAGLAAGEERARARLVSCLLREASWSRKRPRTLEHHAEALALLEAHAPRDPAAGLDAGLLWLHGDRVRRSVGDPFEGELRAPASTFEPSLDPVRGVALIRQAAARDLDALRELAVTRYDACRAAKAERGLLGAETWHITRRSGFGATRGRSLDELEWSWTDGSVGAHRRPGQGARLRLTQDGVVGLLGIPDARPALRARSPRVTRALAAGDLATARGALASEGGVAAALLTLYLELGLAAERGAFDGETLWTLRDRIGRDLAAYPDDADLLLASVVLRAATEPPEPAMALDLAVVATLDPTLRPACDRVRALLPP